MFIPRRTLFLILTTLALGACFDPMVDPIDADGPSSSTDGSATDPAATADSTDTGIADSTGAVDAPPEIQAFTVNGSTAPAEQQVGGMIVFDVDATDDVGIDRVEIYDGGELVATVDSSPYVVEVFVSSVDNGSHAYTAVVVDTVGQTDESGVVPLSVNVVGGAVIELREDIGDVSVAIVYGVPQLAMLPGDDILVTGMARISEPAPSSGLFVRGYSDDLSLLWSDEYVPPAGDPSTSYFGFSAPSVDASGQIAYVGGAMVLPADSRAFSVFSLDTQTGNLTNIQELWTAEGVGALDTPVAPTPSGNVLATAAIAEVASYSGDFTTEHWRASSLGTVVTALVSNPQEEAFAVYMGDGCATGARYCLAKLSALGDVLWTRALATDTATGLPTRPTISSNGNVAVASPVEDGVVGVLVFDDKGNDVSSITLDGPANPYPIAAAYTPNGDLVIVGGSAMLDARIGWATRLEESGNLLWNETYEIGSSDSTISSVAISSSGKLYVAGYSDPFDFGFLSFDAHAWIAELAL